VVASDEQLRVATADRDAASAAVVAAADAQLRDAQRSADSTVAHMLTGTDAAERLGTLTSVGAVGIGVILALLIGHSIAAPVAVDQQGAATAEIARTMAETARVATEMTARASDVATEAGATGHRAAEVHENSKSLRDAVEALRHSVIRIVRTAAPEVDRRQSLRWGMDLGCRVTSGGQTRQARVVDLSATGAGLRGASDLPTGSEGTLNIEGVAVALPFVVRRSGPGLAGVAFALDAAGADRFGAVLADLVRSRAA
jgi:hypothetical protein